MKRLLPLILSVSASGATYYVSPTGADSNPGTLAAPFATIQRGANTVSPGDTVVVRDGTYSNPGASGTGSKLVTISRGGTPAAPVIFTSEHPGGAVLDGLSNLTAEAWSFYASYVQVRGFEIRGFSDDAFSTYGGGQFITISGNNIHDIGRYCTSTGIGRDGIFLSSPNAIVEQNLIHDIGRFGPGENGCSAPLFYQTNDHGIYVAGANNILIRNNIFYRNSHGWSVHIYPAGVSGLSILGNTFVWGNAYSNPGFIIFDNSAGGSSGFRIIGNIAYSPFKSFVHFSNTIGYSGTISNNVTFDGSASDAVPPGVTIAGNLDNTNPLLTAMGSSAVGSPAGPDAHLTSGSPAIGKGVLLAEIPTDFAGVPRAPVAAAGAYQFVPAVPTPPVPILPARVSITVRGSDGASLTGTLATPVTIQVQ